MKIDEKVKHHIIKTSILEEILVMASAFEKFKSMKSVSARTAQKMATSNGNQKDERFWYLTRDAETGKGEAVIRFLPPKSDNPEAMPYVKLYSHFFKGDDGRWVVTECCPRSFGKPCPICERNSKFYNSGNIERYRRSKARTNYIFNILVVNDTAVPSNNGKVFMFETGSTIFNMITEAMTSEYDDAALPFEVMEGNNFILRSRKDPSRGGMISYDKSKFETQITPIAKDDSELERIFNSMYDLEKVAEEMGNKIDAQTLENKCKSAFIEDDPGSSLSNPISNSNYVDYSEHKNDKQITADMDKLPWDEEPEQEEKPRKSKPAKAMPTAEPMPSDEDDDDLDFFRKLAN